MRARFEAIAWKAWFRPNKWGLTYDYCTALHLKKRTFYRWLFLILSIGLPLQSITPLQDQEVWDETLFSWPRSKRWFRRRRLRCHHGIVALVFLARRGWVLFCRLGLTAALLAWGGWAQRWSLAWALLSLPLIDALLSLLPLLWPGVLKVRAYLHLVRGARDL